MVDGSQVGAVAVAGTDHVQGAGAAADGPAEQLPKAPHRRGRQVLHVPRNRVRLFADAIAKGIKFDNLSVEGSESKYTVSIISNVFEGKSTIQRHKMIYALLDGYIKTGEIHALTIKALTLDESKN